MNDNTHDVYTLYSYSVQRGGGLQWVTGAKTWHTLDTKMLLCDGVGGWDRVCSARFPFVVDKPLTNQVPALGEYMSELTFFYNQLDLLKNKKHFMFLSRHKMLNVSKETKLK